MNFGNCCIRARKAHTSIRKFSKENLTVKVSGVIVDAHLIPMKFRTEGRQPLKIFFMRLPWLRVWNAAFLIVKKLDGHYNSCYIKDMVSFYHICEALKKRWISTIISEMLKKRRVSAIKWKPKNARFYKGAGNGSFFLRNLWNSIT